ALLSIPVHQRYRLPELTPQQQKDRTLATIVDQLIGLTSRQPVVFIFEDAHWIDPTSLELLELVVERITDLPVLMVITYRPEFAAPWIGSAHVSLHALKRLTLRESLAMVARVTGERSLAPDVLAQIAERTDGVPLFIEELTRSVLESGADLSDGEAPAASGQSVDLAVPASLQDALEARLDRSPAVREVAQVGAAIGREFPYDLLARVVSLAAVELDAALDDLAGSGLIFARGAPPNASYTFKHALIQDTAYDSMVRSTRHDTHTRIANSLIELRSDIEQTAPELLAHHYSEAGQPEEAIDWWTRAGQAASARSANPEAVALLERGLDLVGELPVSKARDRRELALQTALFSPLISVKGQYSAELEAAFTRTLELCEKVDAPDEMFRALHTKSLFHAMRGQHSPANDVAVDLVQRAEGKSDEGALMAGHRMVAVTLLLLGRVVEAQEHIDIVLSRFDRARHGHVMVTYGQDPEVTSEGYNSVCQWVLGWPDKARAAKERAIEQALELDHVNTIGVVLSWSITFQSISRDTDGLRRTCQHFQALTSHHKMPIWEAQERLANAVMESRDRPSHQTATELHGALEQYESLTRGLSMMFPIYWAGYLAENYLAIGDPAKALDAIEKGSGFAKASGEQWSDSELFRMRGAALALRDGVDGNDEAEGCLRCAIDVARSRQAKSFELRAATSLARFLRDQGRSAEAYETLVPIYDWFTEGFDTPDLKDAKVLLDELS
ncbi:MAG: adenylate cyclase, partial [Alphaproteobacteria bacterium]|nr:adenylate cyclase [Alphaproteobacteria bacterium]